MKVCISASQARYKDGLLRKISSISPLTLRPIYAVGSLFKRSYMAVQREIPKLTLKNIGQRSRNNEKLGLICTSRFIEGQAFKHEGVSFLSLALDHRKSVRPRRYFGWTWCL